MDNSISRTINEQGEIVVVGNGVSMWPMLKPNNNLVKIKKIYKPLKKYDVVLFEKDNRLVLHRIIKINNGFYDISGDSTYAIERNVPECDILGVLETFVRNTKKLNNYDVRWISIDNSIYQIYARLIVFFMPIRRCLLGIWYKSHNK